MHPRRITDGLIIRDVKDECVVYHTSAHRITRLNRTAVLIWRAADGNTSPADIAARVGADVGQTIDERTVLVTLRQLQDAGLAEGVSSDAPVESRREMLARVAAAAAIAALVPLVMSLPSPVLAQTLTQPFQKPEQKTVTPTANVNPCGGGFIRTTPGAYEDPCCAGAATNTPYGCESGLICYVESKLDREGVCLDERG